MILKTTNLTLRPWEESDAKCLYHFARNPKIGPIAGWPPHESIENSLEIINTVFAKRETYAIVKDDIPIGCVGLLFHPDTNHWWGEGSVELGYWVAEEYWGNGYATEASQEVIKRAFNELGANEIYASYRHDNKQSGRVLEKLGFKFLTELNNINYAGEAVIEIAMKLEK
ncbi:GNAT family N-acetyltransferase [Methanobrevibacter sp.]|uniref:GNAT family N-acetyltransferase n=1 Tax=Methanobrevibacter sp. TaxID=66852 RepID=UPI0038907B72